MDAVKIDIELPSLGLYTKEELTELIQSYAMSMVLSNRVSDLSVEDELRELNRRAAEMENDPTVAFLMKESIPWLWRGCDYGDCLARFGL